MVYSVDRMSSLIALVRTLDLGVHPREMVIDVVLLLVRVALHRSDI